ncbi:biotin--[acetyl-CoA-carboxylase] ligase [Candidatus Epulonipiscium viviparus]|uniref:biotin--[acetyl-CoA-carboxylase] ligase n=1 Tax=Candidatus Epulonipiscium viviparus TaxID=420336 RepID=UPI00273809E4|nr:biotin--[acetyl-CoA-carboxylase] ligase [Candidatus Epulopiscium viviparus]
MTKNDLIKILSNNQEQYLSGEFLAHQLGVSRTAIWKYINSLKNDGYTIDAIRNKGYRLDPQNDILNSEIISQYLLEPSMFNIECYDVVSSTNLLLKQRYAEPEGLVIIANAQEAGMGRVGRTFFSPKNSGIYFSVLLKPNDSNTVNFVTAMAGVAVCKAITKIFNLSPKIKWVNDIYLNNKKICGILTQSSFSLENNTSEYVILGIGINVYSPPEGFPSELENIAGSIISSRQSPCEKKYKLKQHLPAIWLVLFLFSIFSIFSIKTSFYLPIQFLLRLPQCCCQLSPLPPHRRSQSPSL